MCHLQVIRFDKNQEKYCLYGTAENSKNDKVNIHETIQIALLSFWGSHDDLLQKYEDKGEKRTRNRTKLTHIKLNQSKLIK
jgi:hypothetical protein